MKIDQIKQFLKKIQGTIYRAKKTKSYKGEVCSTKGSFFMYIGCGMSPMFRMMLSLSHFTFGVVFTENLSHKDCLEGLEQL